MEGGDNQWRKTRTKASGSEIVKHVRVCWGGQFREGEREEE